ncbi:MAG: YlbF family regulator [Ruminococcaceae bacterium]|nr:YlbF family regulator [Oscillospiraceae bacterium]
MDKILELTKDLAHEIQMDERFVRMQLAQQAADADEGLQTLIGDFNLKRMALATETAKDDDKKDPDKMKKLDEELRALYAEVMSNENMKAFNVAKAGMDELMNGVSRILTLAAQGVDPDSADMEASCSGNCSTCGGCH